MWQLFLYYCYIIMAMLLPDAKKFRKCSKKFHFCRSIEPSPAHRYFGGGLKRTRSQSPLSRIIGRVRLKISCFSHGGQERLPRERGGLLSGLCYETAGSSLWTWWHGPYCPIDGTFRYCFNSHHTCQRWISSIIFRHSQHIFSLLNWKIYNISQMSVSALKN
jgi:hypothetical protein